MVDGGHPPEGLQPKTSRELLIGSWQLVRSLCFHQCSWRQLLAVEVCASQESEEGKPLKTTTQSKRVHLKKFV